MNCMSEGEKRGLGFGLLKVGCVGNSSGELTAVL